MVIKQRTSIGTIELAERAALFLVILLCSCTENRSVPTLPDAHPDKWMLESSPDFHGAVSLSVGMVSCAKCHGDDFEGGRSGVSCIDCHSLQRGICTACHGGLYDSTGAPPYSLSGDSLTSSLGVGAHQAHLRTGKISDGVPCSSCHSVPVYVRATGHYDSVSISGILITDSIAEVTWGPLAGSSSDWDRLSATCSGTYCHGNFMGGYPANIPVWTSGTGETCGACHDVGSMPWSLGGEHDEHIRERNVACHRCHNTVVDSSLTVVGKDLHINGLSEVSFSSGNGTYSNGSCSGIDCHGTEHWYDD